MPITPQRERDGRTHSRTGRSQRELAAKYEYGFLVPYYPPDFNCGDLRVGLEVLEREGGYGEGGVAEIGSPDELLLVGREG